MIHLDTNYLIAAVTPGTPAAAQVATWIAAGEGVAISAMAWAEFTCGPLTPNDEVAAMTLVGQPLPITAADATRAAAFFNLAGRRRGSLPDCLIAAVALRAGLAVATANRADFALFAAAGLQIVP